MERDVVFEGREGDSFECNRQINKIFCFLDKPTKAVGKGDQMNTNNEHDSKQVVELFEEEG